MPIQSLSEGVGRLQTFWRGLGLARQFLLASAAAIIAAMAIVGGWLSTRIETAVTQNSALDAALYVEAVVGERIQGLADSPNFDPTVQNELSKLVIQTPLGRRVVSFKVWVEGGRVIYSSKPEHVGQTYPPTDTLRSAWRGTVVYEFDSLHDSEDAIERNLNVPLLEIYVPVRKRFGGDVIAVVEFYEDATALVADIWRSKMQAWLLLAAIGAGVVAALYGMARRASLTIERQQAALSDRIVDLSRLLEQNRALSQRVEMSSRRAAALNERYLRRIGSDLHDGPAQLISLAMLRLDSLKVPPAQKDACAATSGDLNADKAKIRAALGQALNDIRGLSVGLSVPELEGLSLKRTIMEAIRAHEHRSETRVEARIGDLDRAEAMREEKIAAYRFLQEGLNNAVRHASGADVSVTASMCSAGVVQIEIADTGPGFDVNSLGHSDRLGLTGMRERVECVGGTLDIKAEPQHGTRLRAKFPVGQGVHHVG